ncbi:transposase [Chromobacterium violaceum]|nr:transposase [Chromobacterium violaceum]
MRLNTPLQNTPCSYFTIQKILLLPPSRSHRGRPPWLDDFTALSGILFVLTTGIPWEDLPHEIGFASRMTCWRRLRDW